MCRLLLRPILLLALLIALPIFFIRAQPYDDSELRAFLTPPEGCPAPCFMGIRPGVTTLDEAVAVLEAHEWVAEVRIEESSGFNLVWDWSGKQPAPIIAASTGHALLIPGRDTVDSIAIDSNIRIGDLYLLLGLPDKVSIQRLEEISYQHLLYRYRRYYGEYTSDHLGIMTTWGCPLMSFTPWPNLSVLFWNTSVGLIYPATLMDERFFPDSERLIYPKC